MSNAKKPPKKPLDGKPRGWRGRPAIGRAGRPLAVHERLGFRPAEFAALIGVSHVTVWRAIRDGNIRVIDQNGIKIIPRSFVIEAGYITSDDTTI
jgi:hypothetical protein